MDNDDFDCVCCGAPATCSIRGQASCGECDPYEENDEPEPPHWPHEIPSGLMGLDERAP